MFERLAENENCLITLFPSDLFEGWCYQLSHHNLRYPGPHTSRLATEKLRAAVATLRSQTCHDFSAGGLTWRAVLCFFSEGNGQFFWVTNQWIWGHSTQFCHAYRGTVHQKDERYDMLISWMSQKIWMCGFFDWKARSFEDLVSALEGRV